MKKMSWDELLDATSDDAEALDKQLKTDEGIVIREWVHPADARVMLDRLGLTRLGGFVHLRRYMNDLDDTRKVIAVGVETYGKSHHVEWIAEYIGPLFDNHGQLIAEVE